MKKALLVTVSLLILSATTLASAQQKGAPKPQTCTTEYVLGGTIVTCK